MLCPSNPSMVEEKDDTPKEKGSTVPLVGFTESQLHLQLSRQLSTLKIKTKQSTRFLKF